MFVPEPDAAELTALRSAGLMRNRLPQEQPSAAHSDSQPGATHTHTHTHSIDNSQMEAGLVQMTATDCCELAPSPAGSGSPHRGHC